MPDIREARTGSENRDLHLGENVGILKVMVWESRVEEGFGEAIRLYNVQPPGRGIVRQIQKSVRPILATRNWRRMLLLPSEL